MKHIYSMLALVGVVFALSACAVPPYVHNASEFNRSAQGFGQPKTDISAVTICYNSRSATPRQVSQLAISECARFNKTAQFSKQSIEICPLQAPSAAVYDCIGDGIAREGTQGIPSGTLMNYDGIQFRY